VNLGIIIQARMLSSRLPGKVLKPIAGRFLLDHVLGRLEMLPDSLNIVVATSNLPQDNPIVLHCEGRGVLVFRGSEADVLDRYYCCAQKYKFNHIVRLTADNPFTDIKELQRLIKYHLVEGYDYTHCLGSLPLGVGSEIFTFGALQRSALEGHAPNHREHVNEYITEHPKFFRIGELHVDERKRRPEVRLTVDTEEDYSRACAIAEQAPERWLGTEEAISLCSRFV